MPESGLVSYETSKIEWDGRKMSLVYGIPSNANGSCAVIAHGAGGPMYSPFITFFHTELAKRGFLTVKFNFPYMEAKRRIPDRKDVLEDSFSRIIAEINASPHKPSRIFLGGKSMGGRIASQAVAGGLKADGLFFLGYPLHPPGRTDKLRDEHLYKIRVPMLFISGTRDQFADRELLAGVVGKIGPLARLEWIDGGDHSLNTGKGKTVLNETYVSVVSFLTNWLNRVSQGILSELV